MELYCIYKYLLTKHLNEKKCRNQWKISSGVSYVSICTVIVSSMCPADPFLTVQEFLGLFN